MRWSRFALSLWLALLSSPSSSSPAGAGAADAELGWTQGTSARLRVVTTAMPRHDGSYGGARLELQRLADRSSIARRDLEGLWQVLGYAGAARVFVMGGQFETGAWLPLDVIQYLDEQTGVSRASRYGDGSWMAFAAVPGPDGRFVVFVGQSRSAGAHAADGFRLQVLDVARDALYDLGRAPAPPPAGDKDDCALRAKGEPFDWGDPVDGLTAMDPGIIAFLDPHTVRVSYGADSCLRRARKRSTRVWDLARIAASRPMIAPRPQAPEPKTSPPAKTRVAAPGADAGPDPHF